MKLGFWRRFFMVLGVIFAVFIVLLACLVIYAIVAFKSLGVKQQNIINLENTATGTNELSNFDHPLLSESQENLLEGFGIDVSALPTEITEEQKDCAVQALGASRVKEIMSGSSPTVSDYLK